MLENRFAGKPLQVIDTSDIGFFGAQAFIKQDEYKGRCISLAGDELSFENMASVFKSKTRKCPDNFRLRLSLTPVDGQRGWSNVPVVS